jgi:hypothetical protein
MLDYWLALSLVEEKPMGQEVLHTLQRASSPAEWAKRAAEFFNAKVRGSGGYAKRRLDLDSDSNPRYIRFE